MRILELTNYSSGGCGVYARVKQEAEMFAKRGNEVMILSSNLDKGSNKIVASEDKIGDIQIFRYPATKLGGESFMLWLKGEAFKKALEFNPDIIIAHNYRHPHTTKALTLCDNVSLKNKPKHCKIFLVTHAPFVEGNITRTKLQTFLVDSYDKFIGRWNINKFDKILAISHWEIPSLLALGAEKERIVYSPNGIPEEFFTLPTQSKEENKILFLGRVAPKKRLQDLIACIPYLKDKDIKIEIVGPQEEEYFQMIKGLDKTGRVTFSPAIYDLKEKIKKIDSCRIFVLPSRVEGMPQSLVEGLVRNRTCIGSDSIAIRDIIQDNRNGYLFEFDNPVSLAGKINYALEHPLSGRASVRKFNWNILIEKMEALWK